MEIAELWRSRSLTEEKGLREVQEEGKGRGLEGECLSSGRYNSILQTGWLINNRNVLLRSGKV